jgi:hypothetical protein
MRDYEVKCKVNVNFNVVMQTDGVDMFSAMAKVEKIIRDILINSKGINALTGNNEEVINIVTESECFELNGYGE